MTALKTPEKTSRRQELRRNWLVELYGRLLLFYEDNRTLAYGIGVGILALALAVPGYMYYQQQQSEQANDLLGQILPVYEQGNLGQALEGTGDTPGLLEIANQYDGTTAGNLSAFYAATALYQQEEYDRALEWYQRFEKDDDFIGASALAGEAAIYETQGEFEQAAARYEDAANQYDNELTAPRYLLEAGQAYEEAGDYEAAADVYEQVLNDYPDSDQAADAERFHARAEARLASSGSGSSS